MNTKIFSTLLFAAILCLPLDASAQVTIGSENPPSPWSLLDLDNSERVRNNEQPLGLHLPRIEDRDNLNLEATVGNMESSARGLMIYNTDTDCLEFWNGSEWVSLCKAVLPEPTQLTCGVDGVPLLVRIGENYYYTHYFMTMGEYRCWMVQNSREGTPNDLQDTHGITSTFPGQAYAERGYYYANAASWRYACPPGWSLPSTQEFDSLVSVLWDMHQNDPTGPSRFWTQPEMWAGLVGNAGGDRWGVGGFWRAAVGSNGRIISIENFWGGIQFSTVIPGAALQASVRCIKR